MKTNKYYGSNEMQETKVTELAQDRWESISLATPVVLPRRRSKSKDFVPPKHGSFSVFSSRLIKTNLKTTWYKIDAAFYIGDPPAVTASNTLTDLTQTNKTRSSPFTSQRKLASNKLVRKPLS